MPRCRPSTWAAASTEAAMALSRSGSPSRPGAGPILQIDNLDVHFGRAHALQGVSLSLDRGVLAVVGRNGMGKSTLCNAITGLVPASGAIRLAGQTSWACRPTGSPISASATCRRGGASGPRSRSTSICAWRSARQPRAVDRRAHLPAFPRLAERKKQWRRPALRRRAADAGDRPRPAVQAQPAGHGRADRGPGPGHRRPGGRDAEDA